MLLSVMYGQSELGAVHPLALTAPRDGGPLAILLAGRSWEVVDVDWPRRRISVVAAKRGGRARWLGGGRPANFAICRSAEAVISGASPGCTLSKRAAAKLDDVKTRLPFVESTTVPVVSNDEGSVRVWTFAGGLVNSALARATGGNATRSDDFCITIDPADAAQIYSKLAGLNAEEVRPLVPEKIIEQLKFRECLPDELAMAVVEERLSDLQGIRATLDRPRRIIRDVQ
jgi:ATP-dependent helicase Lhr and Lhr-like helicase